LQNLVIEFNEVQAAFQPLFVGFRRQHPVDAEMPANVAQKGDVIQFQQPVGVVGEDSLIAFKVEVVIDLPLQRVGIGLERFSREHLPHFTFAAGVADHGRAAADQPDDSMPSRL
jgi:hypothetical protein